MKRIVKAALVALWFMVLTFPIMGIKVNSVAKTLNWRWDRSVFMGVAMFFLALLWSWCFERKARGLPVIALPKGGGSGLRALAENTAVRRGVPLAVLAGMIAMPLLSSIYQTNIMISALLYVMLALGLNIVVGLAGQLVLDRKSVV